MTSRIFWGFLLAGLLASITLRAQELPEGKEKATVESVCTKCHSLERIVVAHHTLQEWKDVVRRMVLNGAALNPEGTEAVTEYLAKNFGPANARASMPDNSGDARAQHFPFKPIAGVYQLMEAIIIPASDVVWHVAMEPPQDDKEWAVVQHNALTLAEAGNLLLIGSRAKDQDNWVKAAWALIDSATIVFRAAAAKDVAALNEAGDQLVQTCRNCHRQYKINTR